MMVVQMHGEPGSGKTTLARALAPRLPALHLDKDVMMTAIMKTRIPREIAGPASYEALWDLAVELLQQQHSVIIDCPAYWPEVEQRGLGVAMGAGASYLMVEVTCGDSAEIDRRLSAREGLPTNPTGRHDWLAVPGTREPSRQRLVVDSSQPVDEMVDTALQYLLAGAAP